MTKPSPVTLPGEERDDEASAAALAAFNEANNIYASYMGDPDGNDDTYTASNEAAKVLDRFARDHRLSHPVGQGEPVAWMYEKSDTVDWSKTRLHPVFDWKETPLYAAPQPIPVASPGYGSCDLCASECRGHSLGHEGQWDPEPGSRAYGRQQSYEAGLAEGRVSTGAECRMRIALEAIKDPPTKNGFRELALWMQATAKEALL